MANRTPEQHTASMLKDMLNQLGYLNNTFGDVRNTLNNIATNDIAERKRLTDMMSRVLESLGKLGPEFRVAMKEANSSEDILNTFNKALHGNGGASADNNTNSLLRELIDSIGEVQLDSKEHTKAMMEQTKDYHSEFKASFIALGDKITKAIEDANQALIANNISSEKSNRNLLSNKDDRDRMSQKRFFDKLGKIIIGSKPAKEAKNALTNLMDISFLYSASQAKTEFGQKMYIALAKGGFSKLLLDAFGAIIGTAIGGFTLGKLIPKGLGRFATGGWSNLQKNYARDLRNARTATKLPGNITNPLSRQMDVKQTYSRYRTSQVGNKLMTPKAGKIFQAGKTLATAGKVVGSGAKFAVGGLGGLVAGLIATPLANFAVDNGANPYLAHGLSGATIGASIGVAGGPVGAAIVGGIGLIGGLIKGYFVSQEKKQNELLKVQKEHLKEFQDSKTSKGWNPFKKDKKDDKKSTPVSVGGTLATASFRVDTDNSNRATVDYYLSRNPNYINLNSKEAGLGTYFDIRNTNGNLDDFPNDSTYVNKGTLGSLLKFLDSPEGKQYKNKIYVTSGTSTLSSRHIKNGDHNGGLALDLVLKGLYNNPEENAKFKSALMNYNKRNGYYTQVIHEDINTSNEHHHIGISNKGAKDNFNYKSSAQENSVGTTNIISSASTKRPVNISVMPTGSEQYSAMITRSNLFLGDVGYGALV